MPLNDLVASPLMADSRRPQPVHRSSGIAVVETTAAFRNRPDGLRKQLGLSCRWLYGAVRQQCAGHLPFKRRETANGGFSVLPTGTTDPKETFVASLTLRQVSKLSGRSYANSGLQRLAGERPPAWRPSLTRHRITPRYAPPFPARHRPRSRGISRTLDLRVTK